jgi:hypothetical protein
MKIAILGNMNNNGFSIMRYLRDLGEEADLLLFEDDGIGSSAHFSIKSDTWNYNKWLPFIKTIPAVNSYGQALSNNFICRIILKMIYPLRILLKSDNAILTKPASYSDINKLKEILDNYDFIIGSGASPAIMNSLNKKLSLFFAYSIGIEYLYEEFFALYRKSKNPLIKFISNKMFLMQAKGIRESQISINTEFTVTKEAFQAIGCKTEVCHLPTVYAYENHIEDDFSLDLKNILKEINDLNDGFVIVSHARHQWKKPKDFSLSQWKNLTKNNNWLLQAFNSFLKLKPESNSLLILFEYGEDFQASKDLCSLLGIDKNVRWLPLMQRKEILEIIDNSDIAVGEFYDSGIIWGSTGWEVLSKGKPLLQGFKYDKDKFFKEFGHNFPPILVSNSEDQIIEHLIRMFDNRDHLTEIGLESQNWFNEVNGLNAGRKIIKLLKGCPVIK